MSEEQFAESMKLIFLKHAENEKPVGEYIGLLYMISPSIL